MILRALLLSATCAAMPIATLAPFLAGCASTNTNNVDTISAQVVQDVNLIANGLEADLPALQATVGGNPAATKAVLEQVKAIVAAAATLEAGVSKASGQSVVAQISADYAALMQALGPFMALLPQPIPQALTAIGILLPVIEIAIGMIPQTVSAQAGAMTPAQARGVLATAAQQ